MMKRNRKLLQRPLHDIGDIEGDRFENFVHNLEIPKLQDFKKEEPKGENNLEEC